MLVITRRPDQIIRIGDSIELMVVSVQGDKVRLGISAPRNINIVREELIPQYDAPPPAEAACDVDQPDMGGEGGGNR